MLTVLGFKGSVVHERLSVVPRTFLFLDSCHFTLVVKGDHLSFHVCVLVMNRVQLLLGLQECTLCLAQLFASYLARVSCSICTGVGGQVDSTDDIH